MFPPKKNVKKNLIEKLFTGNAKQNCKNTIHEIVNLTSNDEIHL